MCVVFDHGTADLEHGDRSSEGEMCIRDSVRAAVSRIQNGQICRLAPQRVTGVERAVLCIVARKESALSVPFLSLIHI